MREIDAAICPDCAEPVEDCRAKASVKGACWRWNDEPPLVPVVENPEAIGDPDQEPVMWLEPMPSEGSPLDGVDYDGQQPEEYVPESGTRVPVLPREHGPECRRGLNPCGPHYGLDRERCERCRNLRQRLTDIGDARRRV